MAQELDRADNLSGVTRENGVSQLVRSNPENERSRRARALKEKAEDEQKKKQQRHRADRVQLTGEADQPQADEDKATEVTGENETKSNDEATQHNDSEEQQPPRPSGIDVKA